MSDLRELYQEVILDHCRAPRNTGTLPDAHHRAEGHNPLCGDRLVVTLLLDEDVIRDVRFQGSGCAISTASASTMTEAIKGQDLGQVEAIFGAFHAMVMGRDDEAEGVKLGKLAAFAGVAEFPMRVKCATLCWHTLRAALDGSTDLIKTE